MTHSIPIIISKADGLKRLFFLSPTCYSMRKKLQKTFLSSDECSKSASSNFIES